MLSERVHRKNAFCMTPFMLKRIENATLAKIFICGCLVVKGGMYHRGACGQRENVSRGGAERRGKREFPKQSPRCHCGAPCGTGAETHDP